MKLTKHNVYGSPRYWYHISTNLKKKVIDLIPLNSYHKDIVNRPLSEPSDARICVAPSVEHCITALPYCYGDIYNIYRTQNEVIANPPRNVHDSDVTLEGWIQEPTTFVKIGVFHLKDVDPHVREIITESASGDNIAYCKKVLNWWKRHDIQKYIKPA